MPLIRWPFDRAIKTGETTDEFVTEDVNGLFAARLQIVLPDAVVDDAGTADVDETVTPLATAAAIRVTDTDTGVALLSLTAFVDGKVYLLGPANNGPDGAAIANSRVDWQVNGSMTISVSGATAGQTFKANVWVTTKDHRRDS